jgi:hypothetical protein
MIPRTPASIATECLISPPAAWRNRVVILDTMWRIAYIRTLAEIYGDATKYGRSMVR